MIIDSSSEMEFLSLDLKNEDFNRKTNASISVACFREKFNNIMQQRELNKCYHFSLEC